MTLSAMLSIARKPGLLAMSVLNDSDRRSEKSAMKNGIWRSSGRQEPSGFTFSRW